MKKIVFLGSKAIGYDCLQYLLESKKTLKCQVIAIGTKPNTVLDKGKNIAALAQNNNIPIITKLSDIPLCDLLISVQYHKILKQQHIDRAKDIAVNLHMAPLPEYRGCNQFSFAIVDGATEFGTTIHRLETGIDSGAILFEKRFPIPTNCFVTELYELTYQASVQLFQEHIGYILTGNFTLTPQATLLCQRTTSYHFRHEIHELKQIDLSWEKEKIERHFRATYFPPFESPYAIIAGKKVYFQLQQ